MDSVLALPCWPVRWTSDLSKPSRIHPSHHIPRLEEEPSLFHGVWSYGVS